MADDDTGAASLAGAVDAIEGFVLGEAPSLTRVQVSEQAGVPLEVATGLWQLLGFAHASDDEVAFTPADVHALELTHELVGLGILGPERQAALVRTWGRSFARLAEWQTELLATVALEGALAEGGDPAATMESLVSDVLPRVEQLQSYVWRRHLASAGARLMTIADPSATSAPTAVGFVDIVGYTSRAKSLDEVELVAWLEGFEARVTSLVTDHNGRIIKNIGDEVLFACDHADDAVDVAVELARLGDDEDDPFPAVRAGVAYGEVVTRLGDVFGETVNIASRLTSAARPGTVLIDRGAHDALRGDGADRDDVPDEDADSTEHATYSMRRVRRLSVKGYARLAAWSVRHR